MIKLEEIEKKLTKMQSAEGQRLRALVDTSANDYEKKDWQTRVAKAVFIYNQYNFIKFVDNYITDQLQKEYDDAVSLLKDVGRIPD